MHLGLCYLLNDTNIVMFGRKLTKQIWVTFNIVVKITGFIPGGGNQSLLLTVAVSTPKLVIKMPPAFTGKKYRSYGRSIQNGRHEEESDSVLQLLP